MMQQAATANRRKRRYTYTSTQHIRMKRTVSIPFILCGLLAMLFWNAYHVHRDISIASEMNEEDVAISPVLIENQKPTKMMKEKHRKGSKPNNSKVSSVTHTETLKSAAAKHFYPQIINFDGSSTSFTVLSKTTRSINIDEHTLRTWRYIKDDENYNHPTDDDDVIMQQNTKECQPMSSWYNLSYPTCNIIHEIDIPTQTYSNTFHYLASGGSNDVFKVTHEHHNMLHDASSKGEEFVLKKLSPKSKHRLSLSNEKDYTIHNFDIVKKDALITEQLTKSKYILPLYSYCGFVTTLPYERKGTFEYNLKSSHRGNDDINGGGWKSMTSNQRLKYALDAANGLADVHDIGVVHADLTIKQYLVQNDDILQLNDFNRAIMLQRNTTIASSSTNKTKNNQRRTTDACTFIMTHNYGTTRAPEEYKHHPQTISVDVWSLGSIIHHILTGNKVWKELKKNKAQQSVIDGKLPRISSVILNSTDPVDVLLMKARDMCYVYDPKKRASARQVANFLHEGWKKLSAG